MISHGGSVLNYKYFSHWNFFSGLAKIISEQSNVNK